MVLRCASERFRVAFVWEILRRQLQGTRPDTFEANGPSSLFPWAGQVCCEADLEDRALPHPPSSSRLHFALPMDPVLRGRGSMLARMDPQAMPTVTS